MSPPPTPLVGKCKPPETPWPGQFHRTGDGVKSIQQLWSYKVYKKWGCLMEMPRWANHAITHLRTKMVSWDLRWSQSHYDDVTMSGMASQITSLRIVYSTVYPGPDQRKHQSPASLAFVREIHRGPVNFPHKWPVTRKMFPFDDVIMHPAVVEPQHPQAFGCPTQMPRWSWQWNGNAAANLYRPKWCHRTWGKGNQSSSCGVI